MMMDRWSAYALDRWLTREPEEPEEMPLRHCVACGCALYDEPDFSKPWTDGTHCDGKLKKVEESYEEETVRILGEEFRGKTYTRYYFDCEPWDAGEGSEEHAPHFVIEAAGWDEVRICPNCGNRSVEHMM